jgi:cytochrome c5
MSEIHLEDHHSPIQTPKQLIVAVVLAFVVPIAIIVLLTQFLTLGIKVDRNSPMMSPESIAERLRPAGQVVFASAGGGTQAAKSGEEVVKAACAACHATGALNAPKIGDNAAWGKVAAQGLDTLIEHAVKGIRQMPARGGNPALSDLEIARAIVYMANQSGQKL